jgi:hypothetical protein
LIESSSTARRAGSPGEAKEGDLYAVITQARPGWIGTRSFIFGGAASPMRRGLKQAVLALERVGSAAGAASLKGRETMVDDLPISQRRTGISPVPPDLRAQAALCPSP